MKDKRAFIEEQIITYFGGYSAPEQAVIRAVLDNTWTQGDIMAMKRMASYIGSDCIESITIEAPENTNAE